MTCILRFHYCFRKLLYCCNFRSDESKSVGPSSQEAVDFSAMIRSGSY